MIKNNNINKEIANEKTNEISKESLLNDIKKNLSDYSIEINDITIISSLDNKSYLGNIKLFDIDELDKVKNDLEDLLNSYGDNSINSRKITPCCSPSYFQISFKLNIPN